MGYESARLKMTFDSMVSVLSMGGYLVEGFIEDIDEDGKSLRDYYAVYSKLEKDLRVGFIYRNGVFEFEEGINNKAWRNISRVVGRDSGYFHGGKG